MVNEPYCSPNYNPMSEDKQRGLFFFNILHILRPRSVCHI